MVEQNSWARKQISQYPYHIHRPLSLANSSDRSAAQVGMRAVQHSNPTVPLAYRRKQFLHMRPRRHELHIHCGRTMRGDERRTDREGTTRKPRRKSAQLEYRDSLRCATQAPACWAILKSRRFPAPKHGVRKRKPSFVDRTRPSSAMTTFLAWATNSGPPSTTFRVGLSFVKRLKQCWRYLSSFVTISF